MSNPENAQIDANVLTVLARVREDDRVLGVPHCDKGIAARRIQLEYRLQTSEYLDARTLRNSLRRLLRVRAVERFDWPSGIITYRRSDLAAYSEACRRLLAVAACGPREFPLVDYLQAAQTISLLATGNDLDQGLTCWRLAGEQEAL